MQSNDVEEYICTECGQINQQEWCDCTIHTNHTIYTAEKPPTARKTAATPPFSDIACRWLGWSKRPKRRQWMEPQSAARMIESQPDFRFEEMTRSSVMLDGFLAYVVVPCLGVLTVLSTVYIIVSVLDLFLWEMLEIMRFPIL